MPLHETVTIIFVYSDGEVSCLAHACFILKTNNFLGSGRRGDGKIFVEVESFIGFRKETAQASILTDTMGAFQTEELVL